MNNEAIYPTHIAGANGIESFFPFFLTIIKTTDKIVFIINDISRVEYVHIPPVQIPINPKSLTSPIPMERLLIICATNKTPKPIAKPIKSFFAISSISLLQNIISKTYIIALIATPTRITILGIILWLKSIIAAITTAINTTDSFINPKMFSVALIKYIEDKMKTIDIRIISIMLCINEYDLMCFELSSDSMLHFSFTFEFVHFSSQKKTCLSFQQYNTVIIISHIPTVIDIK